MILQNEAEEKKFISFYMGSFEKDVFSHTDTENQFRHTGVFFFFVEYNTNNRIGKSERKKGTEVEQHATEKKTRA